MPKKLSNYQKQKVAKNLIERLKLKKDLNNLGGKLDELFTDAPVEVAKATSKEELSALITEVRAGTATNEKISRFLELAGKLGIS